MLAAFLAALKRMVCGTLRKPDRMNDLKASVTNVPGMLARVDSVLNSWRSTADCDA